MTDETEVHPIVQELVTTTMLPYGALLPVAVLDQLGSVLGLILTQHPFAVGLVARLSPALRVEVAMDEVPHHRDFQGFALPTIYRAMLGKVRENAKAKGVSDFIPPDLSMAVLCAYVRYQRHDDRVWRETEAATRQVAQLVSDGIMAALFLGLMQELARRPAVLGDWGDAGRALGEASPQAKAVLKRALSKLPPREQTFLQACGACAWKLERVAKRLRLQERKVNAHCDEAVTRLGEALRAELTARPPTSTVA